MESAQDVNAFVASILLCSAVFILVILAAAVVERVYETEERRKRPRPKIDARERQLLGDDWRDRI